MPLAVGTQYAAGPLGALLVMGLLALATRWAFGTGWGRGRRRPPDGEGLLTCVATLTRPETATALRAVLSEAGIRSTVRCPAPHRADVLVFPEDAGRARALASAFPGQEHGQEHGRA